MTAQTLDRGTLSDVELPKKEYTVERARVPLVLKLFGLTALLIVIVVAIAVGITIERANAVANETVSASINGAAKVFRELEDQRLARLRLPAELLGVDKNFVGLVQAAMTGEEPAAAPAVNPGATPAQPGAAATPAVIPPAAPSIDLASIMDQIEQRRESFRSDLVMLLDKEGRLIARTDVPVTATPPMTDLYARSSMIQAIVEDASVPWTVGVMALDGKLYHAAVTPVGGGARDVRIGYLVNAVLIDEKFANSISESTRAGVIFTAKGETTAVRSSDAPSIMPKQVVVGKTQTEKVDQSEYILTSQPLLAGRDPVGTAIFLRSKDRELAPFREIENSLMTGGGVALLLAFLLSWLIAKRVTRPIEQLAGIAQAVTAGDYSVGPDVTRNDEVGILGRSFGKMINSLRDKAELEELYAAMAEKSDEAAAVARPTEAARLDEGTVLVTDLRGLPATVGEGDAASVIATVERAMRLQEAEVARQDGEVREVNGHRLISVFRGERGIIHAIRAARAINEELASQLGPGAMSLGVGIATGEFVSGSVTLKGDSGLAIVGNAPLLALLFAWHAPNGYAYVSYETAQAAGGEVLTTATREEVRLKWLPNALPVASLPLVSVTTGMMRSMDSATSTMDTLRMSATQAGTTAPGSPYADLPLGHLFANRYQIESILGRGGMGVVYKATDTQLDETVAIKTLPGDVMTRSPEDLERFKREIRLARRITHRNVLRTYDYGEAEGVYFISMEFVRGYTLSELLDEAEQRQMPTRAAAGITRQICRGLQAAHEQGIIHRDIKPQNVLVDAKGEAKLMDFGIARMAETMEGVTQAGLIVGTPHYMSPEQVQGKQLDARSDVYSLGVLIYEMLVGRRPFESTSLTGILAAHITENAKPPIDIRSDISSAMNAIVMRCLAKDPRARYANAGELLGDMEEYRSAAA
jgi:HAMP domain-containing protein/predicted Ser/Thr protein kinase